MASVGPLVRLLKLVVGRKAKVLATGEKVIRVCLFLRIFIFGLVVMFAFVAWKSFESNKEGPAASWSIVGVWLLTSIAVAAVWWQKLQWRESEIGVRGIFRRMRRYEWNEIKLLWGTHRSWCLEMADGSKFRGNDWTTGAQEFLEVIREKKGIVLPEY
jgi:hypothetical protein